MIARKQKGIARRVSEIKVEQGHGSRWHFVAAPWHAWTTALSKLEICRRGDALEERREFDHEEDDRDSE
jgi:hypothetical protein